MTHKQLVVRAALWLKNHQGCGVVIRELTTACTEIPDAIGWRYGQSILVECKATRSDFLADSKKWFRANPEHGMGDLRYVLTVDGVCKEEELPAGWGLLIVNGKRVEVFKKATLHERCANSYIAENGVLVSAIRRLELSTCVFVRHEELDKKEDAPDAN